MEGSELHSRSNQPPSTSSRRSEDDDESSMNGTETSSTSSGRIDDEVSLELKPYLEIGKQLNVRLCSLSVIVMFCKE